MSITPEEESVYNWQDGINGFINTNGGRKKELGEVINGANEQIAALQEKLDTIENEDFTYNPGYDPLFQSYANQYMKQGQLAAKNAIAESSILTGGYGNSWAASAGALAFNDVYDKLYDHIPELRAAAYDDWKDDRLDKLDDLEEQYSEQEGILDDANADLDKIQAELIDFIAQGIISGDMTEEDIDDALLMYDDTFTEDEISEMINEVLGIQDDSNAKTAAEKAKINGIIADLIATVTKTPELNTEEYISAALGEYGLNYVDYKDSFEPDKVKKGEDGDSGKTPTSTMYSAALAAYEESDEAYIRYIDSIPEYSEKMLDEYITKHSNRYKRQGIQERNYYIANEDDDTVNWFWGNDNNDMLSYEDSNGDVQKVKVKDLREKLIALGMSEKDAKGWINDNIPKKYKGEK